MNTAAVKSADIDLLPQVLRDMARDCGVTPVLRLVEWRGGAWVYVPHALAPHHELVRRLGKPGAQWLVDALAGETFRIPRIVAYLRAIRDAEIIARFKAGETAAALAIDYGLTERHIERILSVAGVTADDRQTSLF